jgi:hypothetical protein
MEALKNNEKKGKRTRQLFVLTIKNALNFLATIPATGSFQVILKDMKV